MIKFGRAARVQEEARAYLAAFDFPTEYRVRAGEPVLAVLQAP